MAYAGELSKLINAYAIGRERLMRHMKSTVENVSIFEVVKKDGHKRTGEVPSGTVIDAG